MPQWARAARARSSASGGYVVNKKARELGIGHELPTGWFTEDMQP